VLRRFAFPGGDGLAHPGDGGKAGLLAFEDGLVALLEIGGGQAPQLGADHHVGGGELGLAQGAAHDGDGVEEQVEAAGLGLAAGAAGDVHGDDHRRPARGPRAPGSARRGRRPRIHARQS
jgi:hypothetical protein